MNFEASKAALLDALYLAGEIRPVTTARGLSFGFSIDHEALKDIARHFISSLDDCRSLKTIVPKVHLVRGRAGQFQPVEFAGMVTSCYLEAALLIVETIYWQLTCSKDASPAWLQAGLMVREFSQREIDVIRAGVQNELALVENHALKIAPTCPNWVTLSYVRGLFDLSRHADKVILDGLSDVQKRRKPGAKNRAWQVDLEAAKAILIASQHELKK